MLSAELYPSSLPPNSDYRKAKSGIQENHGKAGITFVTGS